MSLEVPVKRETDTASNLCQDPVGAQPKLKWAQSRKSVAVRKGSLKDVLRAPWDGGEGVEGKKMEISVGKTEVDGRWPKAQAARPKWNSAEKQTRQESAFQKVCGEWN